MATTGTTLNLRVKPSMVTKTTSTYLPTYLPTYRPSIWTVPSKKVKRAVIKNAKGCRFPLHQEEHQTVSLEAIGWLAQLGWRPGWLVPSPSCWLTTTSRIDLNFENWKESKLASEPWFPPNMQKLKWSSHSHSFSNSQHRRNSIGYGSYVLDVAALLPHQAST